MLFIIKKYGYRLLVALLIVSAYLPASSAQTATTSRFETAPKELQQFIQQAFISHPRLAAAEAEYDVATAEYVAADKAIYNPELELDSEETDIKTSTIGLSQTIDWGDQQGAKTKIARHRLNAALAVLKKEKQQLLSDLLSVLTDFQNKTRLADLSQQRLTLMKNFADVAKQKHAAGDINKVEFDLAQLAYSESIFNNAKVLSEQVEAEQAFYALYNVNTTVKKILPDTAIDFQKVTLPSDLDQFVMSLPQMQIVRANVAASKNTIKLREGEASADPTIAVRGGKEDKENLVGITLTIPINIRNSYSAEIEVARNEYLRAEQLSQQAWRNIRKDIIAKTSHYQLTQQAWRQWKTEGQLSIHRQLKLLKQLWRAGDISTTDYLVQIKQNLDTQSAGIELKTTLWSSWLAWLNSTAQIESWLQLNTIRNQ